MLASHLLNTIPSIMREWRKVLHTDLPEGLTINQFRVLYFVHMGSRSSSYLARHQGVTPAAMSKMIQTLVQKGWMKREPSEGDRRQIVLVLTKSGDQLVKQVRLRIAKRMQNYLDELSKQDQTKIDDALTLLQQVFPPSTELI